MCVLYYSLFEPGPYVAGVVFTANAVQLNVDTIVEGVITADILVDVIRFSVASEAERVRWEVKVFVYRIMQFQLGKCFKTTFSVPLNVPRKSASHCPAVR